MPAQTRKAIVVAKNHLPRCERTERQSVENSWMLVVAVLSTTVVGTATMLLGAGKECLFAEMMIF